MTHKIKQVFLDICIAKKILTNGSNNRFISFIGLSSILGISIGVMALVVVMSVMNGFHFELKKEERELEDVIAARYAFKPTT